MADETPATVHFLPAAGKETSLARRPPDAAKLALQNLGVTTQDLVGNLLELANRGTKIVTVRNGKGAVITETITEDPGVRLKATQALLDLVKDRPKSTKRGFVEEVEW